MQTHAHGCMRIGQHLKETVLWGTITWSEMGKQNTQAEKVCCPLSGPHSWWSYSKILKISPGTYIFQRPFLKCLFLEGLIYGGKFAFQNRENKWMQLSDKKIKSVQPCTRPCQGGGGEAHVAHLNFTTSCVGVYKCLSLIVGFAITVAIWPRDVVSCRNFILRAVATFWAMSLVGIYPGRASCTCTCKWIPCPTQVMGRQVPTSTNMSFVRELKKNVLASHFKSWPNKWH